MPHTLFQLLDANPQNPRIIAQRLLVQPPAQPMLAVLGQPVPQRVACDSQLPRRPQRAVSLLRDQLARLLTELFAMTSMLRLTHDALDPSSGPSYPASSAHESWVRPRVPEVVTAGTPHLPYVGCRACRENHWPRGWRGGSSRQRRCH